MKKLLALFTPTIVSITTFAQLKVNDFSEIENQVEKGTNSVKTIAFGILSGVMALALIFVIWEVATGKPHAKEHVISWFIAVAIIIIAALII